MPWPSLASSNGPALSLSAIPHAYGESSVVLITVRMTLPIDFEYEWIRQGEEGTPLVHRRRHGLQSLAQHEKSSSLEVAMELAFHDS